MAEVEVPNVGELEELKHNSFSRRVALIIAGYAVLLAITSLGGNNAAKDMFLAQQQSSNLWAHFQAKVIREHLYGSQAALLETKLVELREPSAARTKVEALLKRTTEAEARYRSEKGIIEQEAKKLEHERDVARSKDPYFDYAEVLLQIAIVLGSLAILASSRQVFIGSVAFAGIGSLLCLNGYLLLFHLPFFH